MSDFQVKNYFLLNNNKEALFQNQNLQSDEFENYFNNFCLRQNLAQNDNTVKTEAPQQNFQLRCELLQKRLKWNEEEVQRYEIFCIFNLLILIGDPYSRKQLKIFQKMSQFIPTRTPIQCKTHHQKCFNNFLKKIFQTNFGQNIQRFIQNSSKINQPTQMANYKHIDITNSPIIVITTEQSFVTNQHRCSQMLISNNSQVNVQQKDYLMQKDQQLYYQNIYQNFQPKEQSSQTILSYDELELSQDSIPRFDEKQTEINYQQQQNFNSSPHNSVKKERRRKNILKQQIMKSLKFE